MCLDNQQDKDVKSKRATPEGLVPPASPSLGFAFLSGGREARPLPNLSQIGPCTGCVALVPGPLSSPGTLGSHLPAFGHQTKGRIASLTAYEAPGVALGKHTGCVLLSYA